MKEKILPFIIGLLVGAIIATGGFYLFSKLNNHHRGMPEGNPPQMTEQDGNNSNRGTPPAKPNGDNSKDGQTAPPEKPANDNNSNTNNPSNQSNSSNPTNS